MTWTGVKKHESVRDDYELLAARSNEGESRLQIIWSAADRLLTSRTCDVQVATTGYCLHWRWIMDMVRQTDQAAC